MGTSVCNGYTTVCCVTGRVMGTSVFNGYTTVYCVTGSAMSTSVYRCCVTWGAIGA